MARLRRKGRDPDDGAPDETPRPEATVPAGDARADGPWDSTERLVDDEAYVDLGSLHVKLRAGLSLQLPADADDGTIGSAVLVGEEAAVEIRAFAATRSGGLWDEVLDDLLLEVTRLDGEAEVLDGPFGREIHAKVPATADDGSDAFQPSRIIGIEGPRWMLRATFLGRAALEPSDDDVLMEALKDVVVVRGQEPRLVREALLLTIPPEAVQAPVEE